LQKTVDEYVRPRRTPHAGGPRDSNRATDLALLVLVSSRPPSSSQYEGRNSSIYDASVQLIIENVVTSLLADASRRFGAPFWAGPGRSERC